MNPLKTRLALSLALLVISSPVLALPTGPTVAAGSATFTTSAGTLTIANSNNAIINWQGFSIGAGETARFNQPSASSAVLNRVVTASPSSIFGSLTSNGNVFLVNPNGIVFGAGSQVSVGGLTLSTLDIADANFLVGNFNFTGGGSAGVSLEGIIAAPAGLTVYAGGTVASSGILPTINVTIISTGQAAGGVTTGSITLTPGGSLTLTGGGGVTTGSITATSGGSATLAGVVVTTGSITTTPGGSVTLTGGGGSVVGSNVGGSGGVSLSLGKTATAGGLANGAGGGAVSLTAGGGIALGGSGGTITLAGNFVPFGGIVLSNKSPAPAAPSSIPAASPAAATSTGIVAVTSVSLNLQKREVGF